MIMVDTVTRQECICHDTHEGPLDSHRKRMLNVYLTTKSSPIYVYDLWIFVKMKSKHYFNSFLLNYHFIHIEFMMISNLEDFFKMVWTFDNANPLKLAGSDKKQIETHSRTFPNIAIFKFQGGR